MPSLTPALWTSMFELVALSQTASPDWLRGLRSGHSSFFGWELIYNEIGTSEKAIPYSCRAV